MDTKICIFIILTIFLLVIFIILNCNNCNNSKKCLDYNENYIENFNERLIRNGSKRKILKDKLRKEFVRSGRNSVSFLYNNLKTSNSKQLFRRGPNLRLTPEQIQDIINALKADNTNSPAHNHTSGSQTYVQIACSAYDVLLPFLKKVPWQLFSQIYGDSGGLDSDNPQTRINSEKAIGLDLLNYGLGLAGLGFLAGPLSNFLGLTSTPVPQPSDAVIFAKIVNDSLIYTSITTFMGNQNGYFTQVNNFIIDYTENKKYNQQIVCPYPIGCQTEGSGSAKRCDPDAQRSDTITCMLSPFSQDPTIRYDPNILYSTMPSQLASNSNDSSITKRAYLKQILTDPTNALCALVTATTSSGAAINAGIPAMMSLINTVNSQGPPGSALGLCIGFLKQLIIIISYTIAYYHELALLDETILSSQPGYRNPWISYAIGDTNCLYNASSGWRSQPLSQTPTNLLGKLQDICKSFQNYIDTTFEIYFNGLTVVDNQYRDNGCCWPQNPYAIGNCCNNGGDVPFCVTDCDQWYIFHITDTANSGLHPVIPNDPSAPNNTKDWYGAMRTKYPSYSFYYPDSGEVTITPTLDGGAALVIYMNCFREFLNFPYKHFLDYCKMAGYAVPANITGDQLYYNMLNRLLPNKNYNPLKYGIPVSIPFDLTDTDTFNYDISGGYPFGLKSPSFRQGIQKWLNPNQIVLSDSSSLVQDTYEFNTYCSPIINVTPGQMYDATIFNIEGDDASQPWDQAACQWIPDSSGHTVGMVSCLKGGLFPGTSNNINPNSRTAFCVDISGSGSTYNARASPLMRSISGNVDPSFIIQNITTFPAVITYTGNKQRFTLPSNVTKINFYCWGAGGGGGGLSLSPALGGGGACISGTINYNQGDILEIVIGQGGIAPQNNSTYPRAFVGGGLGGIGSNTPGVALYSSGGGGYSSIGVFNGNLFTIVGAGGGCQSFSPSTIGGYPAISSSTPTSTQNAGGMSTYQGGDGGDNSEGTSSGGGGGGGGYNGGIGGKIAGGLGELPYGGNGGTSFVDTTSVSNINTYDGGLPNNTSIPGGVNIPQYISYGANLGIGFGGSGGFDMSNPTNGPYYGTNGGNGMIILEIAQ